MVRTPVLLLLLGTLMTPNAHAEPVDTAPSADVEIGAWLDMLEAALHSFTVRYSDAKWRQFTTGEAPDLEQLERVREQIYANKAIYESLSMWRESVRDQTLTRRVSLLYLEWLGERIRADEKVSELTNELSGIHIGTRAVFEGREATDNELRDVLRFDQDRGRREAAWRARVGVGAKLTDGLARLNALRNQLAKQNGYRDFYALRMALEGLEEKQLEDLLERLDALTRAPYERYLTDLRARLGVKDIAPWDLTLDLRDVQKKLQPKLGKDRLERALRETYAGVGLPLEGLPITWDLEERPGKTQHAFCFGVDVPKDIRVLANLVDGLPSWRTLFHEVGHAVYDAHIDQPTWVLRGTPNGSFAEASAQFFAFLLDRPAMLRTLGLTEQEITELAASERERNIVNLRQYLVWLALERSLYREPEADPTETFWALSKRYLGVEAGRGEPAWAQVIHFTTHPVYLQNYLLADIIAAQLAAWLEREAGPELIGQPRVGALLKERIYRHGALVPWRDLLRQATGEDLDPVWYIRTRLGLDAQED